MDRAQLCSWLKLANDSTTWDIMCAWRKLLHYEDHVHIDVYEGGVFASLVWNHHDGPVEEDAVEATSISEAVERLAFNWVTQAQR